MVLADPPSLLGRATELSRLTDAMRVARKRAVLVVIQGQAGIGKSALLGRSLHESAVAGFDVRTASVPVERERNSFSPLFRALRPHAVASPSSLSERNEVGLPVFALVADARWQAIDALCDEVSALALRGPLMLAIDDVHWADESLLIAIRSLRRRLHDLPILLVVATRPVANDELIAAMVSLEDEADQVVELGPLNESGALALAERRLGTGLSDDVRQFLVSSGGNPLLIHQFSDDILRRGEALPLPPPPEPTFRQPEQVHQQREAVDYLVHSRLHEARSTHAIQVSKSAAVFGVELLESDLALASQTLVGDELEVVVKELRRVGILLDDSSDGSIRFTHDLLRDGIIRLCEPEELSVLHAEAARVIAARNGAAGAVAWHLEQHRRLSRRPESSEMFSEHERRQWLVHAARDASGPSPALAAHLLDEALHGVAFSDPLAHALFVSRIEFLASSGQLHHAEEIARALLLNDLAPEHELGVRWWLTNILFSNCRLQDALEVAEGGRQRATDALPRARFSVLIALIKAVQLDPSFENDIAVADYEATVSEDSASMAIARSLRSRVAGNVLDVATSVYFAGEAVAIADKDPSGLAHRFQPLLFQCLAALDTSDQPMILRLLALAQKKCQQNGTTWAECLYLPISSMVAFRSGRFDDALADARAGVAICEETGVNIGLVIGLSHCALVLALRGDLLGARETISAGEAAIGRDPLQMGVDTLAAANATVSILEGNVTEGIEYALASAEFFHSIGFRNMTIEVLQPALYFLSFAASRVSFLDRMDALLLGCPESGDAFLASARSIARAYRGDSLAGWKEAVTETDRAGWQLRMAMVRVSAAIAADRIGEKARATEWAQEAVDQLNTATAYGLQAHLTAVLGWQKSTPAPVISLLSTTERMVANFMVDGLSNREISNSTGQSIRTVEAHVASVLRKLGVHSRAKAAALLRR